MKYKTKITPQGNNKYVGQLLEEGRGIYTTNELPDPILVSRELAQEIARLSAPVAIAPKIAPPVVPRHTAPVETSISQRASGNVSRYRQAPSAKKCCGRG